MNRDEAQPIIDQIAELLTGISYPDWCRLQHGIECVFSEERCKVRVDDGERLKQVIGSQFS